MDCEFFEFLDTKQNKIYHLSVSAVTNINFLEDISLALKFITKDMINITEDSNQALYKINKSGYIYKDFADKMFTHVQRVGIVDKPSDVQIKFTSKGIEITGNVIKWNKLDL